MKKNWLAGLAASWHISTKSYVVPMIIKCGYSLTSCPGHYSVWMQDGKFWRHHAVQWTVIPHNALFWRVFFFANLSIWNLAVFYITNCRSCLLIFLYNTELPSIDIDVNYVQSVHPPCWTRSVADLNRKVERSLLYLQSATVVKHVINIT